MRVITLTPSATELVCAIGGQSLLVGRSHDSNAPRGIEDVPAVTSSTISSGSPTEIDAAVSNHATVSFVRKPYELEVLIEALERVSSA